MKPIRTGAAFLIAGLTAALVGIGPAGSSDPFRVRIVTMDGVRGPAYYSRAAHGYRFVGTAPAEGVVAALDEQPAD